MIGFLEDINSNITPTDFEKLCIDLLIKTKGFDKLENVIVEHNRKELVNGQKYQLDGYIEYDLLEVRHKVIVECKRYKNPVSREKVSVLKDKVQELGAQKGILITTCGYQEGAMNYAKEHGIGLMRVVDKGLLTVQASACTISHEELSKRHASILEHSVLMYDLNYNFPQYNLSQNISEFEKYLCNN